MARLREKCARFSAAAQAEATREAYASDWRIFERWCVGMGVGSLPATAECVAWFLVEQSERWSVGTVARRVSAIGAQHRSVGVADPTREVEVREVLAGLRRTMEPAGARRKAAMTVEDLRKVVGVARLQASPRAERDAAALLLGFAGGFRRSELVRLQLRDVQLERRGALVWLGRSKTDQEGRGRWVAIVRASDPRMCPVCALERWLGVRGAAAGPLFCKERGAAMCAEWVRRLVQRCAAGAGLDWRRFAAHSLRAGLVTAAHERGVADSSIMQTTGHRRMETMLGYARSAPGRLFDGAAAAGLL